MPVGKLTLTVQTIDSVAAFCALADEWGSLLARSSDTTLPFLLHDWMFVWWQHFAKSERSKRDVLCIKVVRLSTGKVVGILPLMRTDRPSVGPVRSRSLRFLGADPYITELRLAIVDDAYGDEVARAIAAHLGEIGGWDWIHWSGLVRGSAFAMGLEREMHLVWDHELGGNILRLPGSWDEFRKGLRRNIKESLRHCYNSLKRDGLVAKLSVAETAEEVQRALDLFFRLHALRSSAQGTIHHPDRFAEPHAQAFLREVTTTLAHKGIAKVFVVSVGQEQVACRIGFLLPGCIYLYYSGFDPAWGKYGVMTTVVAEIIKYAIDHRIPSINLSTGKDKSKSRWGPNEAVYHDAISVRPSLYSHAAFTGYMVARDRGFAATAERLVSSLLRTPS